MHHKKIVCAEIRTIASYSLPHGSMNIKTTKKELKKQRNTGITDTTIQQQQDCQWIRIWFSQQRTITTWYNKIYTHEMQATPVSC